MDTQFSSPFIDEIPTIYHGDPTHPHYKLALFVNGQMLPIAEPKSIKRINEHAGAILVDGGANYFEALLAANPHKITIAPFCCVGDFDSIKMSTLKRLKEQFPEINTYNFIPDKNYTDLEGALKLINTSKVGVTIFNALGGRIDQMLGNLLCLFRQDYHENVQLFSSKGVIAVFPTEKMNKAHKKDWVALPLYEDQTGRLLHIEKCDKMTTSNFPSEGIYQYSSDPNHIVEDLKLILHCIQHPIKLQIQTDYELFFVIPSKTQIQLNEVEGKTISLIPLGGPVYGVTTSGFQWELHNRTLTNDFLSMSNIAIANAPIISVESGSLLCVINTFKNYGGGNFR